MTNPLRAYVDEKGRGAKAALARDLGVSKGYIGDLVSGRREPTLQLARDMDRVTGGAIPFERWNKNTQPANLHAAVEK